MATLSPSIGESEKNHENVAANSQRLWGGAAPRVIRQITSTLAANLWTALISILFVPIYVKRLGVEAYGIVGLFVTIQNLSRLFDLGIPVLVNRELARMSTLSGPSQARGFVRCLEVLYWGLAVVVGFLLFCTIPFLTTRWLRPVTLDPASLRLSLQLIAVVTVFQWPSSLYTGGLLGLQKQSSLAGVQSVVATVRALGAWALLEYRPTLEVFLFWQLGITVLSTLLFRRMLGQTLPSGEQTSVSWRSVVGKLRLALSLSGIGILSIPLLQMDKVLLSRLLTLENYGRYMLVCTITTSLYMVINAVYNTVFPRLTRVAALVGTELLEAEYLRGTRLMAALLFPVLVVMVLFPREVLTAWTGSGVLDGATAAVLSLLAAGTALHGLAHLPGALQFAVGETRLSLLVNLGALFLCAPLIWVLTRSFGILGGGAYSVVLNLGMLVTHVGLMHRRYLPAARFPWIKANLAVLLAVAAGPLAARFMVPPPAGRMGSLLVLAGVFLIAAAASASATAEVRKAILQRLGWGTPARTG